MTHSIRCPGPCLPPACKGSSSGSPAKRALERRRSSKHSLRARVREPRSCGARAKPLAHPDLLDPLLDMAADLGCELETLLTGGAPRHQVFAGFAAAISRKTPSTAVVFEDVHWADEATLDLLRYLSRRIHRIPALIVLTWRADEVGADHPLYRLLGELPPDATHRLELKPLSLDAVARLAGGAHDAGTVFRLTRGNPFFVTEAAAGGG